MKRLLLSVLVVGLMAGCIDVRNGAGVSTGVLVSAEESGVFCKTRQVSLLHTAGPGGNVGELESLEFRISTLNDALWSRAQELATRGAFVKVHYSQFALTAVCSGSEEREIIAIEEVG